MRMSLSPSARLSLCLHFSACLSLHLFLLLPFALFVPICLHVGVLLSFSVSFLSLFFSFLFHSLAPFSSLTPHTPLSLVSLQACPTLSGAVPHAPRPRTPVSPSHSPGHQYRALDPCRCLQECMRFLLQMREIWAALALALFNPIQARNTKATLSWESNGKEKGINLCAFINTQLSLAKHLSCFNLLF